MAYNRASSPHPQPRARHGPMARRAVRADELTRILRNSGFADLPDPTLPENRPSESFTSIVSSKPLSLSVISSRRQSQQAGIIQALQARMRDPTGGSPQEQPGHGTSPQKPVKKSVGGSQQLRAQSILESTRRRRRNVLAQDGSDLMDLIPGSPSSAGSTRSPGPSRLRRPSLAPPSPTRSLSETPAPLNPLASAFVPPPGIPESSLSDEAVPLSDSPQGPATHALKPVVYVKGRGATVQSPTSPPAQPAPYARRPGRKSVSHAPTSHQHPSDPFPPASPAPLPSSLVPPPLSPTQPSVSTPAPNANGLAIVPVSHIARRFRARRHFRVVLHRHLPTRPATGAKGSTVLAQVVSRTATADSGNTQDDASARDEAGTQSSTTPSTPATGEDSAGTSSAASSAGREGVMDAAHALYRNVKGKTAAAGAGRAGGLVVGKPVQVNVLRDMAEKLVQYRQRMGWQASKQAKARRLTEMKRKKLENLRIEIITKTKLVRDVHERYRKLEMVRGELRETRDKLTNDINRRMSTTLAVLSDQDKVLGTLRSQLNQEHAKLQMECNGMRYNGVKIVNDLRHELQIRQTDLAELTRAIADLHDLKQHLAADPHYLDAELHAMRTQLAAMRTQLATQKVELEVKCSDIQVTAQNAMYERLKGHIDIAHNPTLKQYFESVTNPLHQAQLRMARELKRQQREQGGLAREVEALAAKRALLRAQQKTVWDQKREWRRERDKRHRVFDADPSPIVACAAGPRTRTADDEEDDMATTVDIASEGDDDDEWVELALAADEDRPLQVQSNNILVS